jgi:hypothetical protein
MIQNINFLLTGQLSEQYYIYYDTGTCKPNIDNIYLNGSVENITYGSNIKVFLTDIETEIYLVPSWSKNKNKS